ncbi:CPBP family intramembrane glutamic endopeptidase [Numidum massiliense]|uniref:CPBP family intramembrane glutamic endopeptidase n=1 Tax=Numidum massiliense TaxID=1522315 RepID=UPI0006D59A98|nr:CPBP family intramembrane glutamic endopeptidase [Numidum massiliense]
MSKPSLVNWKLFSLLLIGGVIGSLAVLPYQLTLTPTDVPLPAIILNALINGVLILALATFLGLLLAQKVGLGAPILEKVVSGEKVSINWSRYVGMSVLFGVAAAICIIVFDGSFAAFIAVETPAAETVSRPSWWQGLLASLYGGITEEIQLRLFFMTLLVWLFGKVTKNAHPKTSSGIVWTAIIVAAVLFGVGHLPLAAAIEPLTTWIILRVIVLNAVGGIIFGWLYWKKGLEAAMIAHFSADIVLHVLLPLIAA